MTFSGQVQRRPYILKRCHTQDVWKYACGNFGVTAKIMSYEASR